MKRNFTIFKIIISFIIPYIILYSLYIQFNGEVSPGGGFQAGVIFASAMIAYDALCNMDRNLRKKSKIDNKLKLQKYSIKYFLHKLSKYWIIICAIIGIIIYLSIGLIALMNDANYLNYNVINHDPIIGQHIGIFIIELGVGVTVASIMYLLYDQLR